MTEEEREGSPQPRRLLLWWDLGVGLVTAVLGGVGLLPWFGGAEPGAAAEAWGASAAIALLPVWYLGLGRRALARAMRDEPARRIDLVAVAALVLVVGYAVSVVPSYATLQVIAYPVVWSVIARYRDAVLWSAVLALAVAGGYAVADARADTPDGPLAILIIALLSFGFAVAMGTWITRIFARGEQYRVLAERLRASQAEVAALSAQSGAAAERERLSRELHDTLTQTLAGLVMLSEQAERALDAGDVERARDRVARVGAAAREAVGEARALVAASHPIGDGGLEAALERVTERFVADSGLRVECELASVPLGRERQVVLLRAAQEGLANAWRHAAAERVAVRLAAVGEGGAVLVIEDDGAGPDPDWDRRGGFGLSGLAGRARAVGGELVFGAGSAGGARLVVRLPALPSRTGPAGERAGAGAAAVEGAGT
ncbi:sensor histidine kinase [Leucobacter massiliensis]|uniref:histidine kinase n=1 Tax=Leucobacter massiliensis TaxID=1686285 RepID=A0A2S9QS62_9MICO|nr:sensor histidine kinase [Leucobacter massiliensis]PRI12437.1 hypothetical protein B4915_01860 [Leucobacter massiliensis]